MKITHLWVVTKPTKRSTLGDICFEVDLPHGLCLQFYGGLNPDDIVNFYDTEYSAKEIAKKLLKDAGGNNETQEEVVYSFCVHGMNRFTCNICSKG